MKPRTISKIFFLIIIQLLVTGCSKPEPIWEDTKITDLDAPSSSGDNNNLKTISFDVHKIEFPAEYLDNVNEIYQELQTSALLLNSNTDFKKNRFRAGLGRKKAWRKLNRLYERSGGEVKSSLSYLLNFDQPNYISAVSMDSRKDIFYHSEGKLKGVTIGRGNLGFRITASQIPGMKNFCRLSIVPAFPERDSETPSESEFDVSDDVVFNPAGFNVKISPGDFILIGPREYVSHQYTLPAVLFCKQKPEPAFRIFLILCKQINI